MKEDKFIPNPSLGSYHWQEITRDMVLMAISKTHSNRQAAMYLGITPSTWKKHASMYTDDNGNNCYKYHCNQGAFGIRRKQISEEKTSVLLEIMQGKTLPTNYDPQLLKRKIIAEGFLEEKCCKCNFNDRRASDEKSPLLIIFRDGNKKNWGIDNLALFCYNCYFLYLGDVFNRKQLKYLEGISNPKNVKIENVLDLSASHMKALEDILSNRLQRDPGDQPLKPEDLIDSY